MTTLSKKEAKRLYDIEYRRKNKERIEAHKRAYNSSPAGRAMQKRHRVKFKAYHRNYCRQAEYRAKKHRYDVEHGMRKKYGEFWECMILVEQIQKEVVRLMPDIYERNKMRGNIARIQAKQAMKRHIKFGWQYNWGHILCLRNWPEKMNAAEIQNTAANSRMLFASPM